MEKVLQFIKHSSIAALEFDETIGADNSYQLTITATDADQNNDSAELPLSQNPGSCRLLAGRYQPFLVHELPELDSP